MRSILVLLCLVLPRLLLAQSVGIRSADSVKRQDTTKWKTPEIVVTGFPNAEGKTPAPFEHINRSTIQQLHTLQDIPKIASYTPSALYYSYSGTDIGYSFLNLRGFDQTRISVMVNGIPQNGPEDGQVYWIDMPELAASTSDVTIQRGGGSAYYGSPAIGGSINTVTQLSPVRSFDFTAGYGDFNTHKYSVAANSGLIDGRYEVYGRLSQLHTDGFRDASFVDMNSYFLSVARYDSNLTLQLNFYGGPFTDGLNYYGITKNQLASQDSFRYNPSETFTYERRPGEKERFSQPHYELLTDWKASKSLSIANTIYYIQGDGYFDIDGTWAGPSYFRLTAPYASRYGFAPISDSSTNFQHQLYEGYVGDRQWGWLPRFTLIQDHGELTVAGELRTHRSIHWGHLLYATELPATLPDDYHFYEFQGGKDIANISAIEQLDLSEDVHALASLQMVNLKYSIFGEKPKFYDSATAAAHGVQPGWHSNEFSVPLTFFNPKLGVSWNITSATTAFASGSYTTREPRLIDYYDGEFLSDPNFGTSNGLLDYAKPLITPEHLIDIEAGISCLPIQVAQGVSWSGKINGYLMNFRDEIVRTGQLDHYGSAIQRNMARTSHYGVELQTRLSLESALTIEANLTLSHNEILEGDTALYGGRVVGKVPVGFSPLLANVLASLQLSRELSVNITGRYVGAMYGDISNSDASKNDPYFVADAGLNFTFGDIPGLKSISAKLAINNILNKRYASYVIGEQYFVGAPRHFYGSVTIGL